MGRRYHNAACKIEVWLTSKEALPAPLPVVGSEFEGVKGTSAEGKRYKVTHRRGSGVGPGSYSWQVL